MPGLALEYGMRNVKPQTYAKKVIVIVVLHVDPPIAGFGREP